MADSGYTPMQPGGLGEREAAHHSQTMRRLLDHAASALSPPIQPRASVTSACDN